MPLRDHFRPPLHPGRRWEAVHGMWPAVIIQQISAQLPKRYVAEPSVHLGEFCEIDVATFDETPSEAGFAETSQDGGVATAVWSPPEPTLALETEPLEFDEYEVRIYDTREEWRLVAAIEIISPSNKDRPESRYQFAAKCAALLRQEVTVVLVDPVTVRDFNLYGDVLEQIGEQDPALGEHPSATYAVTCRWQPRDRRGWLRTWYHSLTPGESLPELPVQLSDGFGITLDLESSYEETCRTLRLV